MWKRFLVNFERILPKNKIVGDPKIDVLKIKTHVFEGSKSVCKTEAISEAFGEGFFEIIHEFANVSNI